MGSRTEKWKVDGAVAALASSIIVISLATVVAGFVAVYYRRPRVRLAKMELMRLA